MPRIFGFVKDMQTRKGKPLYSALPFLACGSGNIFNLVSLGLLVTAALPVSGNSLTAIKSKIFFVPGKDFEISWFYNVSRGSKLPKAVKIWAHLNNGSTESCLLWTAIIEERGGNGLDVKMTQNKELSVNPLFKVFYSKTHLKHDSMGFTHRYDLLVERPPQNTSLYDFSCAVTLDKFTTYEKKVKIVRAVKPKIMTRLNENISIRKGDQIDLPCLASGIPIPSVTWTRLFDRGAEVKSQGVQKAHLVISNIQPESTGTYTCESSNLGGTTKKDVAVTVSYLEIDATYGRLHRSKIGKPLRVDCPILGYPEPTYSWSRKGRFLKTGKNLHFPRLANEHFGNYTCRAFNQVGQMGTFVLVENDLGDVTRAGERSQSPALASNTSLVIVLVAIYLLTVFILQR